MKVSLNIVKRYTTVDISVDELVETINEQLGGVDEVIDIATKYKDAVIVRIVDCVKHPDADKLSVCKVDDGGVVQDIERDENGYVQVVCGAPNARADIMAVWLPPRATVPATYADADPFVLDSRNLRGVMSHGMLAAADELDLGGDHTGIIELTADDLMYPEQAGDVLTPGANFAQTFGLDDTIIDIENKMFTHRPDCFGQLGVAREIAGITGKTFKSPEWYSVLPEFGQGEGLQLTVQNDAPDVVPRFMAVAIKNVTVGASPFWLQCELVRLGSKSISNIVDITNYLMLLTGQPLHAYDYDKVGGVIGARRANSGEKLTLLNGKTIELTDGDVVITDGTNPIGLGGVMGGGESEVSDSTTNVILECANFDMYTIRKTSMRHGLFTDAVTRYNKGQSSLQQPYVLELALTSIKSMAGGEQASDVFDMSNTLEMPSPINVTSEFINERLGLGLMTAEIISLLENVEIDVELPTEMNSFMTVQPPYWRTDLELPEDVVEEVGRLYGFDKLPRELPQRSMTPAAQNANRRIKQQVRSSLARAGANEAITYSFVHENVMKRAEQDVAQAFRLSNALSPDLQYYRLSVLPSLLDKVHGNVRAGYDEFALFEIGKGHNKKDHADDDAGLPRELEFVDAVYTSRNKQDGAPFYRIRRIVDQLAKDLGFSVTYTPAPSDMDYPVTAPFDLSRSATVTTVDGAFIGLIGELKQSVLRGFKLPAYTAAMTLDLEGIRVASTAQQSSYRALSKFPTIAQDISLRTPVQVPYSELATVVTQVIQDATKHDTLDSSFTPVSIYQAEGDVEKKTTTFHLEFTSHAKTLTDEDINPIMDAIAAATSQSAGAERI